MNILSLFDGMSCGQLALHRAGIRYDNYYASEIKPIAIKVAKQNYPNTIHIGDVTKLDLSRLPKIDLLIGGSPCQDFSILKAKLIMTYQLNLLNSLLIIKLRINFLQN